MAHAMLHHTRRGRARRQPGQVPQELRIPQSAGKKETVSRRPRKAVRNSIGNMVGKLSVLFTTLRTAASSFLSEAVETRPIYDPIVMFEIGGLDGTVEATDLGKAVIEPMSWEEYTSRTATSPARENLKDLVREQLETGGPWSCRAGAPMTSSRTLATTSSTRALRATRAGQSSPNLKATSSSSRTTSKPTKFALSKMKEKVPLLLMNVH